MEVRSSRNGDGGSSSGSFMNVINGGIFNVSITNHESYLVIYIPHPYFF